MNQLLQSGIIFLIWSIILLRISYKKDAGQYRRHKGFHAFFVIFIVVFHSTAFRMLGWAVGHPNEILEYFYIQKGLFSPATSLAVWILNTIFSVIAVTLGLRLAQRKGSSLRRVFQLIPVIAIVDWLEIFKGSMMSPLRSTKGYVIVGVMVTLTIAIPYGLLLFFYSKKAVQLSIFGFKKEDG